MKRFNIIITAFLVIISISISSVAKDKHTEQPAKTITVKGVSFKMVFVKGGTFKMGARKQSFLTDFIRTTSSPIQGKVEGDDDEKPVHEVTLSDYYIGQTEVTQELWKAVMGENPSNHIGMNLPVENVSWKYCQEFLYKLNLITGMRFRLPTEAEWEYAARGGEKSKNYSYSGSNNIEEVAWSWRNGASGSLTKKVATKAPNSLGLYDMSGNVYEFCQDWYGEYVPISTTNPRGHSDGLYRVVRGGSIGSEPEYCRVSSRGVCRPYIPSMVIGLRLVCDNLQKNTDVQSLISPRRTYSNVGSRAVPNGKQFNVRGVYFNMIAVKGGTFLMGNEESEDASPVHRVTLSDYYIGQTEVTRELWDAVMGHRNSKDDNNQYDDSNYAQEVDYGLCLRFISQLNQITGEHFRLPTEAEWEFAARGGNQSKHYKYAGSNNFYDVAQNEIGEVGGKSPNELGIYDMSGNVAEWCEDRYSKYTANPQTNPVCRQGYYHVVRRGKEYMDPVYGRGSSEESRSNGFRIAL